VDSNDYLMGDGVAAIWADGFCAADASILCAVIPWSDADFSDGHLMRDGQTVELNGGLDEAAVFAMWLGLNVPAEQDLLLLDEGLHFAVTEGMTNAHILDAVRGQSERLSRPSAG